MRLTNYWLPLPLFHPSRSKDQSYEWKFSIQRGGKMIIGNEIVLRILSLSLSSRGNKKEIKLIEARRVSRINYLSIDDVSRCENWKIIRWGRKGATRKWRGVRNESGYQVIYDKANIDTGAAILSRYRVYLETIRYPLDSDCRPRRIVEKSTSHQQLDRDLRW